MSETPFPLHSMFYLCSFIFYDNSYGQHRGFYLYSNNLSIRSTYYTLRIWYVVLFKIYLISYWSVFKCFTYYSIILEFYYMSHILVFNLVFQKPFFINILETLLLRRSSVIYHFLTHLFRLMGYFTFRRHPLLHTFYINFLFTVWYFL